MKRYTSVKFNIIFLDCEDIITKSDGDFSISQNDNDVENNSFLPLTFG